MKRFFINFRKISLSHIAVMAILLLGFYLRVNNYTQYPPRGASSDEYTYTFLGMSLIETGKPTSWSNFPSYESHAKRQNITIRGIYFPLVTPYFDHPPFNGLLVGGWALLNGQNTFEKVQIATIRQIPILLGMVTSLFIYLLALHAYGKKSALWALLIYSTATIFVIVGRTVFAENLLTPLFLLSLLIIQRTKKFTLKHMIVLSIISGISFWTKELGIVVFASTLCFLLLYKVHYRLIIIFSSLSIFIFLLYLLYGYIYNWELFLAIISAQSGRTVGANTLYTLFFHPISVNKLYFDGWYLTGFVSFFASFFDFEKNKFFLIPAFLYFFLMIFSLSNEGEMGWYMLPMFPFFAIFTAQLLSESIKKYGGYIFVVLTFTGMYISQYRFDEKYGHSNIFFRIFLIILFVPLLMSFLFKWKRTYTILSNSWFYALILGTILITYRYIHPL